MADRPCKVTGNIVVVVGGGGGGGGVLLPVYNTIRKVVIPSK